MRFLLTFAFSFLMLTGSASAANLFNYKTITGEGANRFWVTQSGEFKVAGDSVAGRFSSTDKNAWIAEAARLWELESLCTNITGPDYPAPRYRPSEGDFIISGNDVAGRCVFEGPIVEDACDNITGPDYPAPRYRMNDGDWILSGNDVAGRCIMDGPVVTEFGVFQSNASIAGFLKFIKAAKDAGVL